MDTIKKPLQIAIILVTATILYNLLEGFIAIIAGYRAESIALVGFGFDSIIEVSASTVMLWRLAIEYQDGDEDIVEKREQFVQRFVGVTFILLALYILFESGRDLWQHQEPEKSFIGIILAVLSIIVMPLLVRGKMRVAKQINSKALEMEAKETLCCFYLSVILLVGLVLNALLGWWWSDPVAALCMLPWLIREGIEGIKGEECCGCGD